MIYKYTPLGLELVARLWYLYLVYFYGGSCLYLFLLYWTKHYETVVRFMFFVVFSYTAGIITYFGLSLLNHVAWYKPF